MPKIITSSHLTLDLLEGVTSSGSSPGGKDAHPTSRIGFIS